jgi:hypothetical protein
MAKTFRALPTITIVRCDESGIDLEVSELGVVMTSRRHFGDDRFFDTLTASIGVN